MNNADKQYLNLLQDILDNGVVKETRAGKVYSVFGRYMRFGLKEGLPLLTTKRMYYKGIIHELLWFLRGDTNIKYLIENDVHIWDDDAYRHYRTLIENYIPDMPILGKHDFLDKVLEEEEIVICNDASNGPFYYKFGNLGPIYGKQWRDFGGVDQIKKIIETLKHNPDDRRMLCVAYNPGEVAECALPPCHVMFQFYTRELSDGEIDEWLQKTNLPYSECPKRELSLSFSMRSNDFCCGAPYNIGSYAILCHIIANICNMTVGDLIYFSGDTHVYANQVEGAKIQLSRKGHDDLPYLVIKRRLNDVNDINYDDFEIKNYKSDDPIKYPLNVG